MRLFLILTLFLIELVYGYKVLVFNPAFGASHSNFLGKISDILIDAGHDVTMLIPISMTSKKDLVGSKKVTKIIRIDQEPRSKRMQEEAKTEEMIKKQIWKLDADITIFYSMIKNFSLASGYQCEHVFQQTAILEELKNEKFDLGITESLFICGFPLFDHIGVKTIVNADSVLYLDVVKYALGEPASTSFYPGLFSKNIDKMNFLERTRNLFGMFFSWYFSWTRFQGELEAIKPYYNKSLTWEDHINKAAYYLINSNQYLDYASPTLPKTVFIGGMQVNTKKNGKVKLEKEWDDILSVRKQNVLVSFGSNAFSSDMPDDFKKAFLEVFASMPDTTFIWKYEEANATLADHLPNVKLTTWMPQNDLLADDRLSLFVTHGGLGSSVELAYQGKPALVIPLMADQPRNALMLTRHGGALQLDKSNLDKPEEIRKAIKAVLEDSTYKRNAEKLADILSSQPHQPKEVVLKHCDFAVKFGDLETLNSEGRNLNVLQYYSVDIALSAIALIALFLIGVVIAERIAWESKENSFSRFYQEIPKKNEMKHRQTYTDIQKELRAYTHQEAIEFAANTWVWQRSTNKSLPRQDSKSVVASKSETGTRAYYRVLVDKGHKYVLIACHVNLHGFHRGDLRFVEVNDRTIVKGMDKFCVLGMLYPGDVVAVTKLGKKSKVNTMHPSVMTVHPDSSLIWEVQNMTLLPRIKEERPVNFSILENGTAIVEGYSEAMSVIELKNKPLEMEKIYTGSAFFPEKIKINFTEDFHRKYERPLIAITSKIPSYSNCLATIFSYEYSETQTRLFQIGVFAFNPETFLRYSKEADEAVEKCVRMGAAAAQTVSKGRFDGRGFPMRNIRREGLLLRFSIANPIVMPTDGRWNTNSRISIEGIHGTINAIMETIVLDDNKRSIHIAARLPKDYSNNTDFRGVWIVHQLPSRDDVKLKDKFFRDLRENWNGRRVIETLYGGPPMVLTNNQLNLDAIYLFPSNPEVALNRYQNYYVSMILADVPMVLGNSPFGCGKSMTIVTAAIEVHKRNSKYNNHGKQRQQLLVTQTNNAGASLIHIACKVVNVNVKFLRYISEINWDVLPDSSRTIYDMPILMKDLFVRWATRTLENTTKFDKLAVNLKTAIVRKVTQDYIRPEMLDGEAKRIYQNLADVATYTEPSARTLREAFFNVYEPDIIVTTADSLPRLLSCDVLKCVSNIQIDEASQLPEHTLIFLLQRFVHAGYGLVGDIKQLPPHCGKELTGWLKEYGIGNTMERALNSGMFPQSILRIVYRCHPVTTNLLSDLFYDGNLISGVEENDRNEFMRRRPDIWPNPHFPILVLNQDEKGHRMGTSVANDAEKLHVWRIVRCLTQMFNGYQLDESDVGIISFYRAQTSILTEAFRGTGVKCGTVDAFQGTEKEVIIVCCTNEKPSDFMTLGNRLNVAMSRARQATIIIGNVKGLRNAKYWKTIVEKARMNSCLKEIEQFGNTADFYHDALSSFSSSRDNYDDDDDSNDPDYSAFSREAQLAWTGVGNVLESDEEIIWSTATQEEMNGADSWGQQTPQVSLAPIVDQFNDTRISASASSSSSNTQDNEEGMVRGERRHRGSFEII